ncbi:hypothetical protein BJ684DRAFT_16589 [Piptocephalis cylindrospora]|uniref:Uncharacterized protein n=1 Tax=Piptocephalis cylindrospora TaxID=1907219 RepID=A0A4P9Y4A9_9FUNG|nr:hypothetical protein BJ684DRAFT_16589 [Piptocephalis cylindrospora]|eukprot:RKP12971.1 hypothetical protein BJ684DRAFT_16589 [Piptocephalis cylindrospora]
MKLSCSLAALLLALPACLSSPFTDSSVEQVKSSQLQSIVTTDNQGNKYFLCVGIKDKSDFDNKVGNPTAVLRKIGWPEAGCIFSMYSLNRENTQKMFKMRDQMQVSLLGGPDGVVFDIADNSGMKDGRSMYWNPEAENNPPIKINGADGVEPSTLSVQINDGGSIKKYVLKGLGDPRDDNPKVEMAEEGTVNSALLHWHVVSWPSDIPLQEPETNDKPA